MASSSYPAGKTFFSTVKKSYVDVPVDQSKDNAVSTSEFLEANESLLSLFDLLGSGAFSLVTKDLANNIKKVRTRQLEKPAESETIQDLVKNEIKDGKSTATEGLLWLLRGLEFASASIGLNLTKPDKELGPCFQEGYGNTLSNHHGAAVKIVVKPLLGQLPYRKDFYAKLGADHELVEAEMKAWVEAFQKIVDILQTFMQSPLVQNGLPKKKGWF
ncbi:glycolipid transfer protein [Pseudovirgaria hyperparasitica]|uniref:Glycolipid transfer protein n=1 Tax=Pseudovirgaria hyperparasitica TaxID=470096 RepID=A0A6A6WF02_9PEZI|nr:glycolipid transfer protein [Pseudovirgaria hyperparasitica]KAF2760466.1 glycolipid transfer protein [Pseudovirgaria hyperparasitica]